MNIIDIFEDLKNRASVDDLTAAILTLAQVIEDKQVPDKAGAENFGHEMSLGLQVAFERLAHYTFEHNVKIQNVGNE